MEREKINGMLRFTRLPNESIDYLSKREELRLAEIELIRNSERVAKLRRQLPQGATVQDYVFEEGPSNLESGDTPIRHVRLSELFSAPNRPLVVYHLMYGKLNTTPCPMCTMLIDGYNGVANHVSQNVDLVIIAAAEPRALRDHARARGWDRLRLLSCGNNSFKYDLMSEDREGHQDSTLSVFTRDPDGTLRHFYTCHPWMADEVNERGLDLTCAVYNILDLTPQGRGDWYADLDYAKKHASGR
jgi:predicted dithiol-disulfide oxidoreductase (DUF899 family)